MNEENDWRWTSYPARFFFFDARAALALPLFLIHYSWITFGITVVSTLIFVILERKRYTVDVALARLRLLLGNRMALPARVYFNDEYHAYRINRKLP